METFKQFRALNRLYDDLKETNETIEMKRNHLIHHSKELEHKCGILDAQVEEIAHKLRTTHDDLNITRKSMEEVKLDKTRLLIEVNNNAVIHTIIEV